MNLKTMLSGSLLVAGLVLAACQPVQPGAAPAGEPVMRPTYVPSTESGSPATLPDKTAPDGSTTAIAEDDLPPAALNLRQLLAQQLGIDPTEIAVLEAESVEWPDGCLGAGGPEEMCAAVITPGYRIVMEAEGGRYVYHSDPEGNQFRLVEAPQVDAGEALIEWTGTSETGECRRVVVGTDAVAFGRCYSDLQMRGRLVFQQRQDDLQHFLSTFAPFSATTVAGDLVFHGRGTQQATEAEQRQIGEWMRVVLVEAGSGRSSAGLGFALSVLREGGIAALCQNVSVYVTGIAYVADCTSEPPVTLPVVRLNADQIGQLYSWLDTLQTYEGQRVDGTADVMTTTVSFYGLGAAAASEADKAEMEAMTADLAARAQEAAAARIGTCPEPGEGQMLYRNDALGYCLLYPSTHVPVEYSNTGTAFTVGGDLMNHVDARLDVTVSEATGSAGDAADAMEADVSQAMQPEGLPRTFAAFGPVGAVVLDQVPGQDFRRFVYAVHGGRLYTLQFTPSDPALEQFAAMEAFYKLVIESFSFTN